MLLAYVTDALFGMIVNMKYDITKQIPAVPSSDGKLAWVIARIEQMLAALPTGVDALEVWIEISDTTQLELIEALPAGEDRFAGHVYTTEIATAHGVIPIMLCVDEALDDTTFNLSLELTSRDLSIPATGILGFCYPTPVSAAEIETRWVLQYVDGVDGAIAAPLAKSL